MAQTVLRSLEAILLEGNRKYFTSNRLPLSSDFSRVTLEIMQLVVILTESYLKVRLVIRLGFSLLPRLLKIMGQFFANFCDIAFLNSCSLLEEYQVMFIKKYKVINVSLIILILQFQAFQIE